ncbi:HAMP domain-containing histidine kinase [Alteromonadaceae bacterium M269]|nr:HAMP domain-containing histidine kinase [Alteromonadaceae bacterium M269]
MTKNTLVILASHLRIKGMKRNSFQPKSKAVTTTSALLGASLIILFALAWQAVQATRAHYAISDNVLREYAVLVSSEFSRRMTQDIGYNGYFGLASAIREQYEGALKQGFVPVFPDNVAPLAKDIFVFDGEQLFFSSKNLDDLSALSFESFKDSLQQELKALDKTSLSSRPFHSMQLSETHASSVIFTLIGQDIVGFSVEDATVGAWMQRSFDKSPLLPEALANGKLTNDFIRLAVVSSSDALLLNTGEEALKAPMATKRMTEEYSGIFRGTTILVAIDPMISHDLVMGEKPLLRLPLILIALTIAAGLLLVAIQQMRKERALALLRNRFIAEVSHELRTPLTQIRMFAETLLHHRAKDEHAQTKALNIINRESQRLGHLVDNILTFSQRAKRQTLNLKEERIDKLVADAIDELEPLAEQLNCNIALEAQDLTCLVDHMAFQQIMLNLLDNALKYGGKNQLINVRVRENQGRAEIRVIDQGKGVSAEEQEKIWQDFYRPENNAETGVGIGLSIVRELAYRMEGSCWLEEMETGACFVVAFPLAHSISGYSDLGHNNE